jgi:hypothetical protein
VSVFGPQFPLTSGERAVFGDQLLEAGFTPPWPMKEKQTTVLGAALAARAAAACATLASATAVLAGIEASRAQAQADVDAARETLDQIGINSLTELATIDYSRKYAVCSELRCERVCSSWWVTHEPGSWRCHDHREEHATSPASAALEEVPF